MDSNKKSNGVIIAVVAAIIIVAIIWIGRSSYGPSKSPDYSTPDSSNTAPVAVSETTKISGNLSEYQNSELGFSIKYPSAWEKEESNSGVNLIIPIDKSQVSTVNTLQANVQAMSGTCAFPPVVSVKDRSTLKSGNNSFNMISMSNTVQGRVYFTHMYSLQSGGICYMFSFASITLPSSSKNLTGSQATQATNNNKAIVNAADAAFTDMVKSFYAKLPDHITKTYQEDHAIPHAFLREGNINNNIRNITKTISTILNQ